MMDKKGLVPSLSAKAPALMDVVGQVPSHFSHSSEQIVDGLRALAENPGEVGVGLAALASLAASMRSLQEFRKERQDGREKEDAVWAGRQWAMADESVLAYAGARGQSLEEGLFSVTTEANRFVARSDPRAQALEIALKSPAPERLQGALLFPKHVRDFAALLPPEAGVARNHARLAQLAVAPQEAAAAAERAAHGVITSREPEGAQARAASFALLQSAMFQAVALERGEKVALPESVRQAFRATPRRGRDDAR